MKTRIKLQHGKRTEARIEPTVTAPPKEAERAFAAAKPDRLVGRFAAMPTSPRMETRRDLRGLIQHSRWGAQNIDYIRSYEMMVRRHVVGPRGIALQMDVRDENGTPDNFANRKIEAAWKKWIKRGNCTICGRLSFWNIENMAATALAREGNFLLRVWTGSKRGAFQFQVEVLSIDLLDIDLTQSLAGGTFIEAGIEFSEEGKVLAYHMFTAHPYEGHLSRRLQRIRIPADQIVHAFRPLEPMQALGLTETHTSMRRFNMLTHYEEAALTAARYGAAQMLFFKRDADDGPSAAPSGDDGGVPIDEIEAGTIAELPPGYDVANFAPNYPDGEMPAFNKSMLKGGAAGLGVSYAGLTSDMEGANFSSLRDGRGEERDGWRMFQRDLYEALHAEIYDRWLRFAILTGEIKLPFAKLDKFDAATWRPRGWQSVNPKDDAISNKADIENRLRAPSDIVAERGGDYEQTVARIAADMKMLDDAGVGLPSAMADPAQVAAPQPKSEGKGKSDGNDGDDGNDDDDE